MRQGAILAQAQFQVRIILLVGRRKWHEVRGMEMNSSGDKVQLLWKFWTRWVLVKRSTPMDCLFWLQRDFELCSNEHSNFEGMLFWEKGSNFYFLNFLQLGLKFKIFVNWFHCPSAFKVCRFVCILRTSKGTPITNKEGLGPSFSIWSCEVGVMV